MRENVPASERRLSPGARSRAGVHVCLALSIALLTALTGYGGASAAVAHATSPTALPAQAPKPPPTIWAACPAVNRAAAELKIVRRFDRAPGAAPGVVPMPAGSSHLVCGNADYGFYHIESRHNREWTHKGVKSNETWREVVDYALAEALRSPTTVTFRPDRSTFCYSREVYLVHKVRGIPVDVMHPNVIIRVRDGAVITAFPSSTPCRG